MIPFTPKSSSIAAFSIGSLCMAPAGHGQCQYEITAIIQGPECGIFGYGNTNPHGLNDNGEVVGAYGCSVASPFYWSQETGFVMLETPDWFTEASRAEDIANDGTIVGVASKGLVGYRGFHYKDGVWTELPSVDPESGQSWAYAVSPDGRYVVGRRSITSDQYPHNAFIWDATTGKFTDLGVMNGPNSEARDISSTGVAVGYTGSVLSKPWDSPFWYSNGNLEVPGPAPGALYSFATAVNAEGQVFCTSVASTNPVTGAPAVYFNKTWTQMPGLEGFIMTTAADMNDAGQAVGTGTVALQPAYTQACVWTNGKVHNLNDLISPTAELDLRIGSHINNAGQILCWGNYKGNTVGVLLTPIAEPGDLNQDCQVNIIDLSLLLSAWGSLNSPVADLDNDGIVGPEDLGTLLASWG
jgi:uncharacterized membrane protein